MGNSGNLALDKNNLDKEVSVSGWVENIRDHGGVIFIDLREGLDIFQIVVRLSFTLKFRTCSNHQLVIH